MTAPSVSHSPLFSPSQATLATAFGGPLAGAVVMAVNYRHLARPRAGAITLFVGVTATATLLVIGSYLPTDASSLLIVLPYVALAHLTAERLQGNAFRTHRSAGGITYSAWRSVGVGLLSFVAIGIALLALFLVVPDRWLPAV